MPLSRRKAYSILRSRGFRDRRGRRVRNTRKYISGMVAKTYRRRRWRRW